MTISQEITAFLSSRRCDATGKTYAVGLARFTSYLDTRGVSVDDDPAVLTSGVALGFKPWLARQKWQRGRGPISPLSPRTCQLYVRAMLSFYRYLVLSERSALNYSQYQLLAAKVNEDSKYDPPPISIRTPEDDLVQAIVDQAHQPPEFDPDTSDDERHYRMLIWQRNLAIVLCLYSGGMRVRELVSLRYKDMQHKHHELLVTGKRNRERLVRVSGEAWKAIMTYLRDREGEIIGDDEPLFVRHDFAANEKQETLTTRSAQRVVYRLAVLSGVITRFHLTPHSFRHYLATRFLQYTGNLALTQETLGHKNPATTRIYADIKDDDRRQAHSKIFG